MNGLTRLRLWWLKRTQWWSPDALTRFQAIKLRRLVRHAYDHCPYYRRAWDAHGIRPEAIRTLDDVARLPILRREDVAAHAPEITARIAQRFRPRMGSTSGTTGARVEFLVDRDSAAIGDAALWRFRGWHGFRPGDRLAEIRGSAFRDPTGAVDFETVGRYFRRKHTLRLNLISRDPERRLEAVAAELAQFRPKVIRTGSPTLLVFLSLYLLTHPQYRIQPQVVFAGGERLFPDQRSLFAEAFGAPVIEMYANWEYVIFGGECERGRLHLAAEMGIIEIARDGRPCAPGEVGEVVVTNLWNRAFPFVRYAIGDLAYLEPAPCPCGRGLPAGRIVGGKEKDMLITTSGPLFLPNSLIATPKWRGKLAGVRFYQKRPEAVVAQIVRGPAFTDADGATLRDELEGIFAGLLDVAIEYHERLDETPGGKYRYVISRVSRGDYSGT